MPLTTLTARTRAAWERLTEAGAAFAPVLCVAVSPESLLCPPGWTGIVVIDDAAVATAPDLRTAQVVQEALRTVPAALLTDASILSHRLPVAELLGPATLAYLDSGDFRPHQGPSAIEQLGPADSALHRFLSAADAAELEESGIEEITSPAFAVVERGHVAAAAGYRDWPSQVAHLSVLTAAPERGRGLARVAASAAVAHAMHGGRLPQWRARPEASRQVARSLGFSEHGSQVSIRLHAELAGANG